MSGPVVPADAAPIAEGSSVAAAPEVELFPSRVAQVGDGTVRRALPRRGHRTVGSWCFADHMGPAPMGEAGTGIAPHPHIGLQTVTWLVEGEMLHRDSLGSEQLVRAGELNLMTAGHGIAHAEESTGGDRGPLHGIQLWVAQPAETRHGAPAFEHHSELPRIELEHAIATLIVGELDGAVSPARRDTDHVGVQLGLRPGRTVVPLEAGYEHAIVVLEGAITIGDTEVGPGNLAYLGVQRDELAVGTTNGATLVLLGGVPFPEPILMWWNFVARTTDEMDAAYRAWEAEDPRFAPVSSELARIPAPLPTWSSRRPE